MATALKKRRKGAEKAPKRRFFSAERDPARGLSRGASPPDTPSSSSATGGWQWVWPLTWVRIPGCPVCHQASHAQLGAVPGPSARQSPLAPQSSPSLDASVRQRAAARAYRAHRGLTSARRRGAWSSSSGTTTPCGVFAWAMTRACTRRGRALISAAEVGAVCGDTPFAHALAHLETN